MPETKVTLKIIKTGITGELFIIMPENHEMWAYYVWGETRGGMKYIGDRTFSDIEEAKQAAKDHLHSDCTDSWWFESLN